MSYPPQPPYAPRPQSDPYYPPPPTTSAAAIVSLICGILGCVPFLTGIIAVITGIIGITVTQRPNVRGTGMAIAGLILGILSLLGWGLFGFGAGMLYIKTGPEREAARLFMTHVADGKFDDAQAEATDQVTKDQLTDANSQIAIWAAWSAFAYWSPTSMTSTARPAAMSPAGSFRPTSVRTSSNWSPFSRAESGR
jgi:hypothetical protein